MQGEVVTDDIKGPCERRLPNVTPAQKTYTQVHVERPFLRLEEGFVIRIDCEDLSLDRFPLVPVASATTSTVQYGRSRSDPIGDEFTLGPVVQFTKFVHCVFGLKK
jgi:hypothetical protein